MYKVDLASLLRLFEEFHRSGSLQTEVPAGTFGLRESARVQIDLVYGKVISCVIQKRDGTDYASGTRALQMVQQVKNVSWSMQADTLSSPSNTSPHLAIAPPRALPAPVPPPRPRVPVPVQIVAPNPYILNSLRFRQRHLFLMIDGKRDIVQLSRLLSLSLVEIEEVLRQLQALGLVALRG